LQFTIFSLFPEIFQSFFDTGLIKKGLQKQVYDYQIINWRKEYGIGNYKAVDDKPFGGGSGMVLTPEPIFQALSQQNLASKLYQKPIEPTAFSQFLPNNFNFFQNWQTGLNKTKRVTISLTPRGFPLNQEIVFWLANNFDQVGLLCGRYEGFDSRVSGLVDLELSIGNYVLGGGELAAMVLIEAITRLLTNFLEKQTSSEHDSFSSSLNFYNEIPAEFLSKNGKNMIFDKKPQSKSVEAKLFDNQFWKKQIMPKIEHPQFTRPYNWRNQTVPEVLLSGDHKKVASWRQNWWL